MPEMGDEFDVYLGSSSMKVPKWRLGAYTSLEAQGIRLTAIHPYGSVAEWNAYAVDHYPERIIKPGDMIVEIEKDPRPDKDGVRGSGEILRKELFMLDVPMRCTVRAGSAHTGEGPYCRLEELAIGKN
eukprot:CAMPEP_0169074598 /NCGR_PEP_ID=MMETSP1015-20121227/7372_1 /TAXON_ID=342587 /ORGANISM="Karlodinium micrum, Strain CCMP2283" /LENGTH=127 /DNA_ID=CAMNT_0009133949 /DNA_START=77 /DNA_END=460 /DNA_ORIENTATION=-